MLPHKPIHMRKQRQALDPKTILLERHAPIFSNFSMATSRKKIVMEHQQAYRHTQRLSRMRTKSAPAIHSNTHRNSNPVSSKINKNRTTHSLFFGCRNLTYSLSTVTHGNGPISLRFLKISFTTIQQYQKRKRWLF